MADFTPFVRWFKDIGLADVPQVGGKNASLDELYRELAGSGVRVPNGFAITADAYWHFLDASGLSRHIPALLECRALKRVRDDMGLTNVKIMVPFCRTLGEADAVVRELAQNGLARHGNGLELYMMVEIPSNVILLPRFAEYFDGFSIGSNDLTQLTLGIDRDSEIVARLFDERDPAVRMLIGQAIADARRLGRKIGLCGQAPSDYPEFARFLIDCGIDSMSLNPDAVLATTRLAIEAEAEARAGETVAMT
jgi:pyruvate,water dikinase